MGESSTRNFITAIEENIDAYVPGGYHPLLIGDELEDGRYKILHKLGCGGSATVWLARDMHQERYVAIKVLQASCSEVTQEIGIHYYLSQDPDFVCAPIAKIKSYFTIEGINGRHVCLVLDLYGPSLADLADAKFRPDHARAIARQIAEAVKFLHRNDMAVGDLGSANILLNCIDFSTFSTEALYDILGKPKQEEVICVAKDKGLAKHAPKWVYESVDFTSLDLNLLKPSIVLTDLNEAQHFTSPAMACGNGIHMRYASPEFIFGINRRHTKASDVWALASLFYETRSRKILIDGFFEPSKGHTIQNLIGPPPADICEIAKQRVNDTHDLHFITQEEFAASTKTIEHKLRNIGVWEPWHRMTLEERRAYIQSYLFATSQSFDIESKLDTGSPPPARLSTEEFNDFHDLLSKMLVWNPEKRLTIDQVLAHPWLHKKYDDLDEPSEHWIERYDTGRTNYEVYCYESGESDAEEIGEKMCPSDLGDSGSSGNDRQAPEISEIWPSPGQVCNSGASDCDKEGEAIGLVTLNSKVQPKIPEEPDDSGKRDNYFVTRLLGLPIPKQGNFGSVESSAIDGDYLCLVSQKR